MPYMEQTALEDGFFMREEETPKTVTVLSEPRESSHPWVDLPVQEDDDSIGEAVRYSLDEIRFA